MSGRFIGKEDTGRASGTGCFFIFPAMLGRIINRDCKRIFKLIGFGEMDSQVMFRLFKFQWTPLFILNGRPFHPNIDINGDYFYRIASLNK